MISDKEKFFKILKPILWVLTIVFSATLIMEAWPGNSRKIDVKAISSDWAKLILVLNNVDKRYVDTIDHKQFTEDVLPRLMEELDPHSVYLPPKELEDAEESLQGEFEGIGVQFTVPNDTAIISNVITGGPSEKAGVLTGDRIIEVGGRCIAGTRTPQDTMVSLMRGKKGTKVVLGIQRHGVEGMIPLTITRDKIPQHSIDVAFMLNDTTGYVKLSKFARTSHTEFMAALSDLKGQGMRRLIFDLRDNGGGYLDQAMKLSNEFLPEGSMIVYTEGKASPRAELKADGRGRYVDLPLAVLINTTSASSSEIFAGAMQDNDRGIIYGVRSFGKGLVQEPLYFTDGSGIRLTVARFYTPSGRCIQKPYSDDYDYDFLARYDSGEMFSADSIKLDKSVEYKTVKGRTVYGGGGIVPDVFIPVDTVGVTDFTVQCNKHSIQVKYANTIFENNMARIVAASDMESFDRFYASMDVEHGFLAYAAAQNITPKPGEWEVSKGYILNNVKALVARYTPMGDNAFYPIFLKSDKWIQKAIEGDETADLR
ncbi:MAG: PDZ domain-containing protein [Bacteroidales bacterium]|nr:PDZ domain-containing protein [Bacteroidales bacterium]